MQKIKRGVVNKYRLTELLDDKSLEAINKISKILNGPQYIRSRELKKRDRTFNFFKKLMGQKTGVRV